VLALVPFHSGGPAPTRGGQAGRTAIQAPAALAGIAAALVVAATVTWLALAKLLPRPPIAPPGRALLPLAVAAFALVVLMLVTNPDRLVNGAWLSLALAAVLLAVQVGAVAPALRRRSDIRSRNHA
jgi:hypothetical protein